MVKQVCDLRPSKGITAGESNEFFRNYKTYNASLKTFGFFDPTREHLNFEVGKGGKKHSRKQKCLRTKKNQKQPC